jgi:predicted metalloprotease with PDZ domain
MEGVDLSLFQFDYDLTWMAFFLNADERIYSRYGGRDAASADSFLSLPSLKRTMERVLKRHAEVSQQGAEAVPARQKLTIEDLPMAQRAIAQNQKGECFHCHQVNNFRLEEVYEKGTFQRDSIWVYPPPANVGLEMDRDDGLVVENVLPASPAAKAGVRAGDVIETLNEQPVLSQGDIQWVLHNQPQESTLQVGLRRHGQPVTATLELSGDWRQTDISWRGSMWTLRPDPGVWAADASPELRQRWKIPDDQLALEAKWVHKPYARAAGLQEGDLIVATDGVRTRMDQLHWPAYVRLNYEPGAEITLTVLRNGKEKEIKYRMTQ